MQACLAQWFLRTLGSGNLRGSAYSAVLIADEVNLELVEWCPLGTRATPHWHQ